MQEAGLEIVEMPAEERTRWAESLPNVTRPWIDSTGPSATVVLDAYFAALRERGIQPLRNWDEEA